MIRDEVLPKSDVKIRKIHSFLKMKNTVNCAFTPLPVQTTAPRDETWVFYCFQFQKQDDSSLLARPAVPVATPEKAPSPPGGAQGPHPHPLTHVHTPAQLSRPRAHSPSRMRVCAHAGALCDVVTYAGRRRGACSSTAEPPSENPAPGPPPLCHFEGVTGEAQRGPQSRAEEEVAEGRTAPGGPLRTQ